MYWIFLVGIELEEWFLKQVLSLFSVVLLFYSLIHVSVWHSMFVFVFVFNILLQYIIDDVIWILLSHWLIKSCYVLGKGSSLRLSSRRIKRSTNTRIGQKRRLVRNSSEQLTTIDFAAHIKYVQNNCCFLFFLFETHVWWLN